MIAIPVILLVGLLAVSYTKLNKQNSQNDGIVTSATTLRRLRDIASEQGLRVGVIDSGFTSSNLREKELYTNTIPIEFNSIAPEVYGRFSYIHPCPPAWLIENNSLVRDWVATNGQANTNPLLWCSIENAEADEYEWGLLDPEVAWADSHDIGFYYSALLWHTVNPDWLQGSILASLSVDDRRHIMKEHITKVITHYCKYSNVYAFEVVNEAIKPDGGFLTLGPWYDIPNYIHTAFDTAHTTLHSLTCNRPDIKLYYNDFDFEFGRQADYNGDSLLGVTAGRYNKSDTIYNYLKDLKTLFHTPVDGIGFQTHLSIPSDTHEQDVADMVRTMDRFSVDLGLEVKITEMDVIIKDAESTPYYAEQARQFGDAMLACRLARNCTGFTTWGTHDGTSWLKSKYSFWKIDPLLFFRPGEYLHDPDQALCTNSTDYAGKQYCPKPAYEAVYYALLMDLP